MTYFSVESRIGCAMCVTEIYDISEGCSIMGGRLYIT